jgi:diguanylate cyclase (GGDEF)-like protein
LPSKGWKPWLFPGAVLLAVSAALVNSPLFPQLAPSLSFYYVAVFAAGLMLSWRFNSSRILFSLLVLLIAHRAVAFFAEGHVATGPGRTAVLLMALMVPLNLVVFSVIKERGLVFAGVFPRFVLLLLEAVMVAVLCRPENSVMMPASSAKLPTWAMLGFVAALAVFVVRFFQHGKLIEPGFVWTSAAVFFWLEFAPLGKMSDAYVATAGLILTASLVETSYVLAYHDELTGIRGRRAFNESLLSLDQQYAIAIVDIDHFKKFNDTYGHDVGDQVLCLVASRLSNVSGGGQAFRCGGEEFSIIFRDMPAKDALEHLEALRQTIETSVFRLRKTDRRSAPRAGDPDRRRTTRKKASAVPVLQPVNDLSVTVSIGVAEASTRNRTPEQVIEAADQALYQAKRNGRNRVELAGTTPARAAKTRRSGISQA